MNDTRRVPHLTALVWWMTFLSLSVYIPTFLRGNSPVLVWALMALVLLAFGWLAKRARRAAMAALQVEPTLRGAWLVQNAWWVFPVFFVGFPMVVWIGVVTTLAFVPSLGG